MNVVELWMGSQTNGSFGWSHQLCRRLTIPDYAPVPLPQTLITNTLFDLYCMLLQMEFMGVVCRDAVNDCDIPENCTGNSSQVNTSFSPSVFYSLYSTSHCTVHHIFSEVFFVFLQCPQNVHKMDGYTCEKDQVRCLTNGHWVWLFFLLKKKSLYFIYLYFIFWHYISLYRVAASMDGAKPKTDSASTFGERVSVMSLCENPFCIDKSEISIITHHIGCGS